MDKETARQEIRSQWRALYAADGKGKGITCPLCGSGSGAKGTGITENPNRPGQLKCWNCGFTGDVIDLIEQETGADYNEALNKAAAELGLIIERQQGEAADFAPEDTQKRGKQPLKEKGRETDTNTAKSRKRAENGRAVADYSAYYEKCARNLSDPAAVSYLQARGIDLFVAACFNFGYDPEWISPEVVKKQEAKGSEWRPDPTARLIMPVSNNHYVARAISPDVKEYAKMNETGGGSSGIFNTAALYSDYEAVFVTEGIIDAVSIEQCGSAALALNSTNNAGLLVKQLEAQPTAATLILCLDNDDAGKRAVQTLREGLTRLNISFITADICGRYKDPNEALTGDKAAFEAALDKAEAQTAARPDNVSAYIENLLQSDIERMREAADRKTGFSRLDEKSGGLYPGLYVIAATSSLGKTTFALQLADNLAAAGQEVLFFSMEQSRLELVSKSFTRVLFEEKGTQAPSLALRKGFYPDKLKEAAAIYKKRIGDRLSIIEGNFHCNISFIGDYIRRYIQRTGSSPIIFIDYLQILQPADDAKTGSAKETVDTTVTELKRISRENDLTVFVISSVNRANYLTPIDFESLKESGGIEFTADVIWGLQLQCLNEPLFDSANKIKEKRQRIRQEKRADPRKIELLCLKNRYGIANYSCGFNYFPARDQFIESTGDDFAPYFDENPFEDTPPDGAGQNITKRF